MKRQLLGLFISAILVFLCFELQAKDLVEGVVADNFSFAGTKTLLLVLDCSNSMNQLLPRGNVKRIDRARSLVNRILDCAPVTVNCGFRTYGGGTAGQLKSDCRISTLIVPAEERKDALIKNSLDGLKASGSSPLAYALKKVDLSNTIGGAVVLVITDGMDSCGEDPQKVIQELAFQKSLKGELVIVSLADQKHDSEVINDLVALAKDGQGRFYGEDSLEMLFSDLLALKMKDGGRAVVPGTTVSH